MCGDVETQRGDTKPILRGSQTTSRPKWEDCKICIKMKHVDPSAVVMPRRMWERPHTCTVCKNEHRHSDITHTGFSILGTTTMGRVFWNQKWSNLVKIVVQAWLAPIHCTGATHSNRLLTYNNFIHQTLEHRFFGGTIKHLQHKHSLGTNARIQLPARAACDMIIVKQVATPLTWSLYKV